jgi:hypothetical protein
VTPYCVAFREEVLSNTGLGLFSAAVSKHRFRSGIPILPSTHVAISLTIKFFSFFFFFDKMIIFQLSVFDNNLLQILWIFFPFKLEKNVYAQSQTV